MNWVYEGRCWKFGDNLSVDFDLTKKEFAFSRELRPEVLGEFAMCGVDPDFSRKANRGDIVVAGRRFAHGNPHIQGLLGIAALKLGLVVESIPRGSYRNAVNAGLPFLANCHGVSELCDTGDRLRVNFSTGLFENLSRETKRHYDPLPETLLAIVAQGGWRSMFEKRIKDEGRVTARF